jgi:3-methyladenine DNA glycosylase AlkD
MELVHEYPDITVKLTLFNTAIIAGIPQKLEHNDLRWISPNEIDFYHFCPADEPILSVLRSIENRLQAELFSMRDESYKRFLCPLMPTVSPERVIGIRMPILRKFAKQLPAESVQYLSVLPHKYYEEDNLLSIYISQVKDFDQSIKLLDSFLPHVDNWSTCDMITPKVFRKNPKGLITHVKRWLESDHTYTVRFAVSILMKFYLDDHFSPDYLQMAANIRSNEYYVNMMVAWYFATALAKQYHSTIYYLEQRLLPEWTHKKTIQKALESHRIPLGCKEYLRSLK